jgi:hypothetical protein
MANQLETNDSSLFPKSDEREDSGLQDILSVAAKIKESDDEEPSEDADPGEDSGVIMFKAGDFGGGDKADDDDAVFGSFAGGLASGFIAPVEPVTSPDITPLGSGGSVSEATPADARAKPAEERKSSPLTAIAVVVGLGLAAVGFVFFNGNKNDDTKTQQPQHAELSANVDEAAVGKTEPLPEDPAAGGASAGVPVEPEPEPAPLEAETEGVLGEDAGALLAADTSDAADPMAQKAGLLEGGKNPVNKNGKWDQGTSIEKPDKEDGDVVEADPDPDPDPVIDPKPKTDGETVKPSGPANDDEVDCLLNPDLPKCSGGGSSAPKDEQILAPKLPDSLSATLLKDGFNTVKSKAKACGSKFGAETGTKVKVHVSIEGATGKVTSVEAQGEHAGTDLGKCVEDAVKGATFSQFKKPSQGADYSLVM